MTELPLKVNDTCSYTKTISESDVYLYAGITGDFSQMHMNAEFMKTTPYTDSTTIESRNSKCFLWL